IEQNSTEIRLSGDTVWSDGKSYHDDENLSLDGKEKPAGAASFSFRRIDGTTFDIIVKSKIPNRNLGEVSRFVFWSDGKTMTETKTQAEREAVPEGADPNEGRLIRASTTVLVFTRAPQ